MCSDLAGVPHLTGGPHRFSAFHFHADVTQPRQCFAQGRGTFVKSSVVTSFTLAACTALAHAADMPVKAPPSSTADLWSGFYAGADFGYAAGHSNWTARSTVVAVPALSGSFNLFE